VCEEEIMDGTTVGLLGGGQLGRMMVEAGHRLGIRVAVLDPGTTLALLLVCMDTCLCLVNEHMCNFSEGSVSPAGQLSELAIEGSYLDKAKIKYEHSNSDNELVSLLLYVYLTEN
jgi:phosphoribosylaminoimidazole carboxylase